MWTGQGPEQLTKMPCQGASLLLSPCKAAISFKHWADCSRPGKLAVSDPPAADSQALVPELGLRSPGKEYNPPFSLMGRLPERAA